MKRLGIVVGLGPDSDEARVALELALAARAAGVEVHVFAMDEGVRIGEASFWPELVEAADRVVLCGTNCERRGMAAPEGATLGSQLDHALLVRTCDRVVALT